MRREACGLAIALLREAEQLYLPLPLPLPLPLLREAEQLALNGADLGEGEAARELRVLERELFRVRLRVRARARASYCSPVVEWRVAGGERCGRGHGV